MIDVFTKKALDWKFQIIVSQVDNFLVGCTDEKIAEDSLSDLKIDERPVSAIMTVHTLTKDYQD